MLNAIINNSHEIYIFSIDLNCCYTAFNEKHREQMKDIWDADIYIGMNILDCMNIPWLRENAKKSIDRVLAGESFVEVLHQFDKDLFFELLWSPVIINNKIKGVSVISRDITREKKLEIELKANNSKFISLADGLPGFIAYVNANTLRYEFVSKEFERSFQVARENIIGSHVKEIIGEENFQFALKYINEAKAGKSVSYENYFNLVDGKRWFRVNYSPVFDETGLVSSLCVLTYNITPLK
ncbi:MAG: PAS domain-containing protein [Bacteroidota bacterium]